MEPVVTEPRAVALEPQAPNTSLTPLTPLGRDAPQPVAGPVEWLEIVGAREHNLQVERLKLPKRALIVFTGVSGSGKSSLAFDTLYAEGQRRYIETLSAYARQFLGQLERPHVEHISGLSPTIAIEQKSGAGNPRSTVGTITEVYDYLRVLYARIGRQHCVVCGKLVAGKAKSAMVDEVLATARAASMASGAAASEPVRATILAPKVVHRKGEFEELFEDLRTRGFVRVMVDGKLEKLEGLAPLDKKRKHTIHLVIDRVTIHPDERARLAEAVELALNEGQGELVVRLEAHKGEEARELPFSTHRSCCGRSYPELTPQSFSFNGPLGMCPGCNGLGTRLDVDPSLVIVDPKLSIREGAIGPWATAMDRGDGWTWRIASAVAKQFGVDLDVPWKKLPKAKQDKVLFGEPGTTVTVTWGKKGQTRSHGSWDMKFSGVVPDLLRRYHQTQSQAAREAYLRYFREQSCPDCQGRRLRPESLAVRVGVADQAIDLATLCAKPVGEARKFLDVVALTPAERTIAEGALREIHARLGFLLDVGLDYLALDRGGPTLSGGEAQRIRLASQLGSELSGVMYVLDEPSIGLHPRDNARLIATLRRLRDLGNTVVVVEHDEETMLAADHLVDFGPGAGHLGGRVLYSGPPAGIEATSGSLTGGYLSGRLRIEARPTRRTKTGELVIRGAREHNLRNVDVALPLGVLTSVTGVSGAGKSSLIGGILLPALSRALHGSRDEVGAHDGIEGLEQIERVIAIDQKPIGRTPRSNPGTYTKAFDLIREFYAELPEARARGWTAGRFSFNVKGGRCEACHGDGMVKVEMHFLADVYVPCETCAGLRYDPQTLTVRYKGKSIADILDTDVETCLALFGQHPALSRILRTLVDVGLGYVRLGQTATSLSGGEAQRIKLSRELGKSQGERTLYVLDEPTTGLHFEDVRKLLDVLQRLVDQGSTVVVIEHNLDVIRTSDWVIDLGPEGGAGGGAIVAQGTPEEVAMVAASYTGAALRAHVHGGRTKARPAAGARERTRKSKSA